MSAGLPGAGPGPAPPNPALLGALAGLLGLIILQRAAELILSARNARRLRARGGREHGRGHFPLLVLVHVILPLALAAEVLLAGARPGSLAPLWVALWAAAQALRVAAIRALGDHWNVRIFIVPGAPLVRRGPYRFMAHPNYLAVVIELLSAPMIFGAWRTALGLSLLNLIALRVRVRAEARALAASRSAPG